MPAISKFKIPAPKNHNVSHAAFVQAVVVVVLSAVNGVYSGLTSCFGSDQKDCATNSALAVVLVILAIVWFGFLAALAYAAWIRRTTSLIVLFIILEIIVAGAIYVIDIRHHDNVLGLITSIIDLLLTLWVLYMGVHLFSLRGTSSTPPTGRSRSKLNKK